VNCSDELSIDERVARAAIAALFQREPEIIHVQTLNDGLVLASYQADDRLFAYHVCLDGDRVIWRIPILLPSGEPGRWRDHPLDQRTTFRMDGNKVVVTVAESVQQTDDAPAHHDRGVFAYAGQFLQARAISGPPASEAKGRTKLP